MELNRLAIVRLVALVTAASLLGACTSNPISSDYDTSADFSKYSTYVFMDKGDLQGEQYRSLLAKRLEDSINREMQARGYRLIDASGSADLTVDYHAEVEDRQKVVSSPQPVPTHWGHPWYGPWPAYTTDVRTVDYKQGTLIINLVDNSSKQMVWQGMMQGTVKRSDMENPSTAISNAVAGIFSHYPFTAGSAGN
jgi:hypothetical protein